VMTGLSQRTRANQTTDPGSQNGNPHETFLPEPP